MKHRLELTKTEHFITLFAMKRYRRFLSRSESMKGFIPYFNLVFDRVEGSYAPRVDGGEMISIVKALRHRANECLRVGRYQDQDFLLKLSNRIDEERQQYQYENGPILDRHRTENKKAASAGTLTAVV